jgi:hypothetical protein
MVYQGVIKPLSYIGQYDIRPNPLKKFRLILAYVQELVRYCHVWTLLRMQGVLVNNSA